jgi:hypothetical protein
VDWKKREKIMFLNFNRKINFLSSIPHPFSLGLPAGEVLQGGERRGEVLQEGERHGEVLRCGERRSKASFRVVL